MTSRPKSAANTNVSIPLPATDFEQGDHIEFDHTMLTNANFQSILALSQQQGHDTVITLDANNSSKGVISATAVQRVIVVAAQHIITAPTEQRIVVVVCWCYPQSRRGRGQGFRSKFQGHLFRYHTAQSSGATQPCLPHGADARHLGNTCPARPKCLGKKQGY